MMTEVRADSPGRMARVLLVAAVLAAAYLDFFGYRAQGFAAAGVWNDRLQGVAAAPEQYRVGIVWLAHLLVVHLHIALTMALASIDCVSGVTAVLLLFDVLEKSALYRNAGVRMQWFGAVSFVLLIEWFLSWLLWLQKPETLPAAMLVAAMLWLWQPGLRGRGIAGRAVALVALNLLLATFRADVACAVNLGVLWVSLRRREGLALPRGAAMAVSAAGALLAVAVQVLLMRVEFPQTSYGRVKLWQLWPNVIHATRWPPFVVFLLPIGWMVVRVAKGKGAKDAAGSAVLAGALLYGVLWVVIGKIDEVRIFLPMAFALGPLTAQVAMRRVEEVRDGVTAL
jgi:hypothetical protein